MAASANKISNLQGWIKSNRNSKNFGFIDFTDGTSLKTIQLVYKKEKITNFDEISSLTTGSAIEVSGDVILTPTAKQPFEILLSEIKILKVCDADYPLQKKKHSVEFLREIAHLRPRTNLFYSIMKIRSNLVFIINDYFINNNYVLVTTPVLTTNDAEGAGECFNISKVDGEEFFNNKVSLSVTGQLHAEAYAMAFKKVFTFGPQFRAEKSHTNRHAAEFLMLEPEIAFIDVFQLMDIMEDMLKFIIKKYLSMCENEIAYLAKYTETDIIKKLEPLLHSKFKRLSYNDAIEILKQAQEDGYQFENKDIKFGLDLDSEHERYICEKIYNSPVFVYNYPKELKAFYMKNNDDNKTVAGVDLLVPGVGELCGGSQREDDFETLTQKAKATGMNVEDLQWYIDLRKYGYYKSAGFGLGFERLIMYLANVSNIKDTIPFARTHNNAKY